MAEIMIDEYNKFPERSQFMGPYELCLVGNYIAYFNGKSS